MASMGNMREHVYAAPRRSAPQTGYAVLVRVAVVHDFFNAQHNACPCFSAYPTAATVKLLANLGMVFRNESNGFCILYDRARTADIIAYLCRIAQDGSKRHEIWTRFSIILVNNDPRLVTITDFPLTADPRKRNLYFSNQHAHSEDGSIILSRGRQVTWKETVEVCHSSYDVDVADVCPIPQADSAVELRAISGQVSLKQCRCPEWPPTKSDTQALVKCGEPGISTKCQDIVHLDLATLPEGRYDLLVTHCPEWTHEPLLHTPAAPTPFCFIDLLLAMPRPRPQGRRRGIYPVEHMDYRCDGEDEDAVIRSVEYRLHFGARSTLWRYYIVPRPVSVDFEDLAIEVVHAQTPVTFNGPVPVTLPNGSRAYGFEADKALALAQQSENRFRLLGHRTDVARHRQVLLEPLPVASPSSVRRDERGQPTSDIYVFV